MKKSEDSRFDIIRLNFIPPPKINSNDLNSYDDVEKYFKFSKIKKLLEQKAWRGEKITEDEFKLLEKYGGKLDEYF